MAARAAQQDDAEQAWERGPVLAERQVHHVSVTHARTCTRFKPMAGAMRCDAMGMGNREVTFKAPFKDLKGDHFGAPIDF